MAPPFFVGCALITAFSRSGGLASFEAGRRTAAILLLAFALALPALFNGFPLIFPDSGTYLDVAFGHAYAIDRSSMYGLFLKPLATAISGTGALWLALAGQLVLVAAALWGAARVVAGRRGAPAVLIFTLTLTSVAFHAAQFMPDAFTGAAVLVTWLAARRDPTEHGTPLLWAAVSGLALMHYTHLPLILMSAVAALAAQKLLGLSWRRAGWRAAAAAASVGMAAVIQVILNQAILQQPKVAPFGPLFLYARLNEDGLMKPWLARHCGRDAPATLCTIAPQLPDDSQKLLWGEGNPVERYVWSNERTRWQIIADMRSANRGAILEDPVRFAWSSLAGGADQFVHFAPLDDECPAHCHDRRWGIAHTLKDFMPSALPSLDLSRQVTDTMPKTLIRGVLVPAAALGLLLLPLAGAAAWRRRDSEALSLLAAISIALVLNAALAGALSDVHDRYQSRIVWLVPFALIALAARWKLWAAARDRLRISRPALAG